MKNPFSLTFGKQPRSLIGRDRQIDEIVDSFRQVEVDFLARKGDELIYYQVAATILDANTFRREVIPLKAIKDNHS